MVALKFNKLIDASREKVWNVLWNDETYRAWTSVFSEGSYAETDWKEGSKVLFLDGTGEGMVSTVAEARPNEYMSIKHLGMLKNGVEDTSSEEVMKWAGAMENYTLKEEQGKTHLLVEMDSTEGSHEYFEKVWPTALEKIKELAERN